MAKVTSKRQVTLPKALADRYGIAPGDEIDFSPAGEALRVMRHTTGPATPDRDQRLEEFDRATERQQARQGTRNPRVPGDRGWRREDLYERDSAR
jgi:AbrB family looped-hinge helix DNA binding protein